MGEGDGVCARDEGAAGFARCFCHSVFYCDHLEGLQGPNAVATAAAAALSRHTSHQPSRASLSGGLQGLSCVAGHVCSWRWRPRYANPPLRLRKVPFLPAQKENNKEASVAAACGLHAPTETSKSHRATLPLIHRSVRDSYSKPEPQF